LLCLPSRHNRRRAARLRQASRPRSRGCGHLADTRPGQPHHYQPSSSDPTTGTYTGVGATLWKGTWTGVTHYTISGTANLVTGAGSGELTETFIGQAAAV